MPSLKVIKSTISHLPDDGPVVAVIAGGTTGIGSYIANSLARVFANHGSKLRVYIIGRNASRAECVIQYGKATSPGSSWIFVKSTDLAILNNVDKACGEVLRQESESPLHETPSIDLLYMTFCVNIFGKPKPTPEGLDSFISTVYYARIRFTQQLIPLLTAGNRSGHVISVYAGTFEDGTKPGEFPIGTPSAEEWGISSVRKHACFMKAFVFEEWAQKHAGKLSLSHIFPGLVDGPGFYTDEVPGWFRFLWPAIKLISAFYRTSPEDCGDVCVFLASGLFPAKNSIGERTTLSDGVEAVKSSQGETGGGAYSVGQRADAASPNPIMYEKVRKEDTSRLIWQHTFDILDRIEKENAAKTNE